MQNNVLPTDPVTCDCGAVHPARQAVNHSRSKRHTAYLATIAGATAAAAKGPPDPALLEEKLRVRGRLSGEPAPEPGEYERELAAGIAKMNGQDLDAVELSPEAVAERAAARARGESLDTHVLDDVGATDYDLTPAHGAQEAEILEAAPPWPEAAPPPPGFDARGRQLKRASDSDASTTVRADGKTIRTTLAVGVVDDTATGRAARAARSRAASDKPPTLMEQMLGASPRMTRDDWFFPDWAERNPDGHRLIFTHFYGDVLVVEDRFDTITPTDRHELIQKRDAIAAHNARNPQRAVGYIVLAASAIRPAYELVERALRGETVIDLDLPNQAGVPRRAPGTIHEASATFAEEQEMFAPQPTLRSSGEDMTEIAIYGRALSDEDRAMIERALMLDRSNRGAVPIDSALAKEAITAAS